MPNAVQAVERNGHGQAEFDKDLGQQWQSTKRSRDRCGFKVPADDGGNQVSGCVDVESARGDRAGNTVQGTGVPGDLGAVDGQVRSDGPVQTLLRKDLGRVDCVGGGG
jgi:hypothetical protein